MNGMQTLARNTRGLINFFVVNHKGSCVNWAFSPPTHLLNWALVGDESVEEELTRMEKLMKSHNKQLGKSTDYDTMVERCLGTLEQEQEHCGDHDETATDNDP
eukprot:TRINITY_DN1783_c0_g2_i5.p1 TRINITY_DN1783_c0_g2~~TRINITY_DN1783_c0_g2_i5.p1  ORF type:complete len:103 (+),score=15.43 TRINITY_DN1783_c0_g2_i5:87-395(+)